MFDFWQAELSFEEEEALIEKAALQVEKRQMVAPAIMVLEMHKPLAFIGATTTMTMAPFIVPFLGYDAVHDYSRLLIRRENVERLIRRLEEGPPVAKK